LLLRACYNHQTRGSIAPFLIAKEQFMPNRLIDETSPYLLQHAHNPVEWYPWGEEALARAKVEDKPIFLSIGYAACHWCHVMAHESFEDQATAQLMNGFVNIKVDREERPDPDSIYMNAVVGLTGSGGWPMSVFSHPTASLSMEVPTFQQHRAMACPLSAKCCRPYPAPGRRAATKS
jgi:thiol:disulfide interchange protein